MDKLKEISKILPSLNKDERNISNSFEIKSQDLKNQRGIINQQHLKLKKMKEILNQHKQVKK